MFKKLKLFFSWRKTINSLKIELEQKFNARIDDASRIYTVVNVPENLVGEAYSLKKSDIDKISENFIRQYYVELGSTLNSKGLQELFDVYEIKKVDKYSYLLIVGFKLFNSVKYYNLLYYIMLPLVIISGLVGLFIILR
jgi:hypothetical protein